MAVMSAVKKMNLKTIKKLLKAKNVKIANPEEVLKITVKFCSN